VMMIEITDAKIGRLIKKADMNQRPKNP